MKSTGAGEFSNRLSSQGVDSFSLTAALTKTAAVNQTHARQQLIISTFWLQAWRFRRGKNGRVKTFKTRLKNGNRKMLCHLKRPEHLQCSLTWDCTSALEQWPPKALMKRQQWRRLIKRKRADVAAHVTLAPFERGLLRDGVERKWLGASAFPHSTCLRSLSCSPWPVMEESHAEAIRPKVALNWYPVLRNARHSAGGDERARPVTETGGISVSSAPKRRPGFVPEAAALLLCDLIRQIVCTNGAGDTPRAGQNSSHAVVS